MALGSRKLTFAFMRLQLDVELNVYSLELFTVNTLTVTIYPSLAFVAAKVDRNPGSLLLPCALCRISRTNLP